MLLGKGLEILLGKAIEIFLGMKSAGDEKCGDLKSKIGKRINCK